MPKLTDTDALLKTFQAALNKGDGEKQSHGFITKVPISTGVLLLRDCARQGKQPGPRIREILDEYYTHWEQGVHLTFSAPDRRLLDQIAREANCEREEVIHKLVHDYAPALLTAIRHRNRELNSLLGEEGESVK